MAADSVYRVSRKASSLPTEALGPSSVWLGRSSSPLSVTTTSLLLCYPSTTYLVCSLLRFQISPVQRTLTTHNTNSGLIAHLHHAFYLGIPTVILPPSPTGFDTDAFLNAIERYRVTMVMIAPPILHLLTTHPALDKYNLMSLRTLISGAAPLPPALVKSAMAKLNMQGANVKIVNGYGATETTLTVTVVPPEGCEGKVGSVGVLVPNLEARLVKKVTEQGEVVDSDQGEPGEMWVRGPTIMKVCLSHGALRSDAFDTMH